MDKFDLVAHFILSYLNAHQEATLKEMGEKFQPEGKRAIISVFQVPISDDAEKIIRSVAFTLYGSKDIAAVVEEVAEVTPGSYHEHNSVTCTYYSNPFKRETGKFRLTEQGGKRIQQERKQQKYLSKLAKKIEKL